MDLMIDCMPLYEMIEDDMKNIINCSISSSSSSPSCLSDEEQLALTSCAMFDDLFFLSTSGDTSSQPTQQAQQGQQQDQQQEHTQQTQHQGNSYRADESLEATLDRMSENLALETTNYNFTINNNNPANTTNNNSVYTNSGNFADFATSSFNSSLSSSSACSPQSLSSSLSLSSSSLCAALASTTFGQNSANNTTNNFSRGCGGGSVGSSACSSALTSPSTTPLSHQFTSFNHPSPNTNSSNSCNLSSPPSPNSQLLNSIKQESNSNTTSPLSNTSKYMQDAYLNTNLYHVINPMDLNRNYNHQLYDNNNNNNSTCGRIRSLTINKQQLPNSAATYSQSAAKRTKLNHNPASSTSLIDLLKLESKLIHSDGESNLSNESDSNSSSSSYNAVYTNNSQQTQQQQQQQQQTGYEYSKPLIVATKIESYQLKNLTNVKIESQDSLTTTQPVTTPVSTAIAPSNSVNTQINLIKINSNSPKENNNTFFQGQQQTQHVNKLPIVNNLNHKTIIQYKQLHPANGLSPLKPTHNTIINLSTTSSFLSATTAPATLATADTANGSSSTPASSGKVFPKPPYSYSCLIAMALRNSDSGNLPVSDIYDFIIENFPYYKTARDGWKNSIRHNLSLNKCFEKIENPTNGSKKGCLWALNPEKCKKLEEECKRCRQRDPVNIRLSMSRPDDLNKIERGEQRLKKFPLATQPGQRKPHQQQHQQQASTTPTIELVPLQTTTTNGQISLSPSPAPQQQQQLSDDSFLLEWTNKNSSVILKEEDQYFNDSDDIKFDPILLTGLTQQEQQQQNKA